MRDFFYRADSAEIKLTFKFDTKASWKEVSPDPYHIAIDIDKAVNALSYSERQMNIGPLRNLIFKSSEQGIRIWCEVGQPVPYEIFEESGGKLLTILIKGFFAASQPKENMFSFDFRDANVRDVLMALAKSAGVNIVIDDSVDGTISLAFEGLSFDQALGYILKVRGLEQVRMGKNIIVAEKEKLEKNFGLWKTKRFNLKYIDPNQVIEILKKFIPEERITLNLSTKSIFIKGREEEINQASSIISEIDIALNTKIFNLENNILQDEKRIEKVVELIKLVISDPDGKRVKVDYSQNTIKGENEKVIMQDIGNPRIIVKGTSEELETVEELIKNIDRKLPQIMIEVKLLEINRDKIKDFGVSWKIGDNETGELTLGEMSLGGTMERQSLIEMKIKAFEQKNLARLVGNPKILTLSGNTANISVTDSIPFGTTTGYTEQGEPLYKIETKDAGVKLFVNPILTNEGMILVHIKTEVSTAEEKNIFVGDKQFTVPLIKSKTADTTARLKNGETLIIGGLIKSEDIEKITKIPLLSEIPIIGELFKLRNTTHKETELIIFLTPHLVAY